jgi:hypothetical protein
LYACNSQLQGAAFFSDSRRIFGGMERIFTDYRAAKLNHRLGYSWFEKSTSIIRIGAAAQQLSRTNIELKQVEISSELFSQVNLVLTLLDDFQQK